VIIDVANFDPELVPNCTLECECGRPKQRTLECCSRCRYLDVGSPVATPFANGYTTGRHAQIIAALRGTDGLTILELCRELGLNTDNNNGRVSMLRTMKLLIKQRRVRRVWLEADVYELDPARLGKAPERLGRRRANQGSWLYLLDGLSEREWRSS